MIEAIIGIFIALFFLVGAIIALLKINNYSIINWVILIRYIKKSRSEGYYLFKINTTGDKLIITGTNMNNGRAKKNESLRMNYR